MKTINQLYTELELARRINGDRDYFGVYYYSKSNPNNRHYVIMRNLEEFHNFQILAKDWDFVYNKLAM
jgi:hypothetical protein